MLELSIEGPDPRQRVRTRLQPGETYQIGRGSESDLPVPWDLYISRWHVCLSAAADHVEIDKRPDAANPVFVEGREVEHCRLRAGEHFVMGSTLFHIVAAAESLPSPSVPTVQEVTFDPQELQKVRFRDADKRIDVLSHLPEVIWGARTDPEFYDRLVHLILTGVTSCDAVAIIKPADKRQEGMELLHWERRRETAGEFHPSSRLVDEALRKRRRTVLHVWEPHNRSADAYTAVAEFDWAFCTPVSAALGEPWGLYVAGRLERTSLDKRTSAADGVQLQADVKFTELVAEIISSVQRLKKLERHQSGLRQFFAPTILSILGEDPDSEMLDPRECDVTVLFCDLRGFSHHAEEAADDLIGLLDRVSRALGVMTDQILKHSGVTGDFQGDAALGFWGWPFASDESPLNACRAALGIRKAFAETFGRADHPLADFEMGIGIAHGRAVAGKIGTREQVKVTVFGPVVNLASRLETMTKQLRVAIVLDETTANTVRSCLDPTEGRTRRLAKVLPYGMERSVLVSELLPPASEFPELTDTQLERYDQGVEHFIGGRWEEAYRCLHEMPTTDLAQDFLSVLIAQHNRVAPPDWDGVIRLASK